MAVVGQLLPLVPAIQGGQHIHTDTEKQRCLVTDLLPNSAHCLDGIAGAIPAQFNIVRHQG